MHILCYGYMYAIELLLGRLFDVHTYIVHPQNCLILMTFGM